jgi:hypothetical protein
MTAQFEYQHTVTYPSKGGFMESVLLDVAGHRRSPATLPGNHEAARPRSKGEHYPADPPTVGHLTKHADRDLADKPSEMWERLRRCRRRQRRPRSQPREA